ncbi:MAG TPA: glycosyl hydrolase 115 family protein [Holophaga sp.]|nr:glycosyl hydrolase 115 family protein [Holophaga sp.]
MLLASPRTTTVVMVDAKDWPGVTRAAGDFRLDMERVTGTRPELTHSTTGKQASVIIIGTLGKSALIDGLVRSGKLNVAAIQGKWESWITEVVAQPFAGIDQALVVAGSDKRGAIYGTYDLSEQIGVSPWYWWADVAPAHHDALFCRSGRVVHDAPAVKYRGIFLNDEAPALSGWAKEKFGGLNSRFYAHVFELLLRLRANYLWPAMWNNAFNEDDPDNARLADEYGIVLGTSHHEPMLRSQQEWGRHGRGPWNYETNGTTLAEFWRDGIKRNRAFESIVTIGMRGDGDMAMSENANITLLEKIVHDQREILAREMKTKAEKVPQLWALYKEVQGYYESGMKVPDDVTLLWCDDNYGNIRRLPTPEERKRIGGAGIYYHIDYVGWPRSYKWLNVTPISKIWEQMHLAREYGADRIWILNVGDLKPMEFPIEFFMRYAWAPEQWPFERLNEYGRRWAEREFGPSHAQEIADLVAGYTKLNGLLKPENLSPDSFSVIHDDEGQRIVARWKQLDARAGKIESLLPVDRQDAYFQLVRWPISACRIVNEMNVTAGLNHLYAFQGRAETNTTAARVRELFQEDAALTRRYNEELGKGRWRHFADQTHLGYAIWQQPPRNTMPPVGEIQATTDGEMGVAIEGAMPAWPEIIPGQKRPTLPPLDSLSRNSRWIEVFNRGLGQTRYTIQPTAPWLHVSKADGALAGPTTHRVEVTVDWSAAPEGKNETTIWLKDERGTRVCVWVPVIKHLASPAPAASSFIESEGVVSIEAVHFHRAVAEPGVIWQTLPDFGRTAGGVTPFPVTMESRTLSPQSPRLEYLIHTVSTGEATIELTLSPTLAFTPGRGLRLAVSVDDEAPQMVDLRLPVGDGQEAWGRTVTESVRKVTTKHTIARPGTHVVKMWVVDPAIVLQRVLVSFGEVGPRYLGPIESVQR